MSAVIELKKVTKLYGMTIGVKNVSLKVSEGSIFGFLGPNGAGKTTTISMLVDLIRPTAGSIRVFGLDSVNDSLEIRKRVGFLAGDFALDSGLSGWQQLQYFGALRGRFDKTYVRELADRLSCNLNRKFKTLSSGNKQKVGLVSALMHRPELLIFDEPTNGLDPLIQAEFNKIIKEHKAAGKTAFISSHVLSEVQEICDEVAFVREGSVIALRQINQLGKGLPKDVQITGSDKALKAALEKLSGFHIKRTENALISGTYQGEIKALLSLLSEHKIADLRVSDTDLEEVFMKYYKG